MAKNTKFTETIIKKLEEAILLGAPYTQSCYYAGISYQCFRNWMIEGEQAKSGKKRDFYNRIKQAEGDATSAWLTVIENAAKEGNWQAAAWKLERRYPNEFGKQIRQKVESQNIEIDLSSLTDDQLKRLANGENIANILSSGNEK